MARKHSYNFIKNEFMKKGYELLEKEYINCSTKMRYRCPNHSDQDLYITYDKLKQGRGCKYCGIEKVASSKRKTQEQFVEEMKKINIVVLGKYINCSTKIKVQCNKNHIFESTPDSLIINNGGCPVCSGTRVIKGYNDIATTHPHIIKNIVDKSIIYNTSRTSKKSIQFKCLNCNEMHKRTISHVCKNGFSCEICDENLSFPERIMFNLLKYLNAEFNYDKTTKWSQNKRYDFYIIDNCTIIEMHGIQHYEEVKWHHTDKQTLEDTQNNDSFKQKLALQNNIKNYIIIDSRYSDFNYIKNNIIISKLAQIYDLSKIEWKDIFEKSMPNLSENVYSLWNKGCSICEITNKLKINRNKVRNYLKIGSEMNKCKYTLEESIKRGNAKLNKAKYKKCICETTNEIFNSAIEAGNFYSISPEGIRLCCRNKQSYSGKHPTTGEKLIWKYIIG